MTPYPPRLAYVCTVSGYNQPELEACLQHRPQDLILIVSHGMEQSGAPERLEQVLKTRLPATRIQRLGATTDMPFHGDDLCENQHWIHHVLLPVLRQLAAEGAHCWLNFTGGTKTLSTALLFAYPWDLCEYKPNNSHWLLQYHLITDDGQIRFNEIARLALPSAPPLDIARLHNPSCQQRSLNPLELKHPALSASLAAEIWQGLEHRDQGLTTLFSLLEMLWDKPHKQTRIETDWASLRQTYPHLDLTDETVGPWLTRLAQLHPDAIQHTQETLSLPGPNAKKEAEQWKRWVSGDWLEQHLANSLQHIGIPPEAIGRNLVVTDENSRGPTAGREADLLINWQGKTLLIEIKADIPGSSRSIELEKQISSLGDRFGSTSKILFIGPQLHQKLQTKPGELERLEARCRQSHIRLLHRIDALQAEYLPRSN